MKYLLFVTLAFVPFVSSAATYHYVNTSGMTATVEAPNATVAMETAPNRAPNSGVALDMGFIKPNTEVNGTDEENNSGDTDNNDMTRYQYVTVSGDVAFVYAWTPSQAILSAQNRASNSGVVIAENSSIPSSVEVDL